MSDGEKVEKPQSNKKINFILLGLLILILAIFLGIMSYRLWMINLFCNKLNAINSNNFCMQKVVIDVSDDTESVSEYMKYYCKDRICKKEYLNPQTNEVTRIEFETLGKIYYDVDLINKTYMKRIDTINMTIDYPEGVIQNKIKTILNLEPTNLKNKFLLLLNSEFEIFIEDDKYVCIFNSEEENSYNILVNLKDDEIEFTQFMYDEENESKADCIQYLLYGVDEVTDEDVTLYDLSGFELIERITVVNNDYYIK